MEGEKLWRRWKMRGCYSMTSRNHAAARLPLTRCSSQNPLNAKTTHHPPPTTNFSNIPRHVPQTRIVLLKCRPPSPSSARLLAAVGKEAETLPLGANSEAVSPETLCPICQQRQELTVRIVRKKGSEKEYINLELLQACGSGRGREGGEG